MAKPLVVNEKQTYDIHSGYESLSRGDLFSFSNDNRL